MTLLPPPGALEHILKTLEEERKEIDATLLEVFTDAELRFGVHAPGGWILKSRSQTSWDDAPEIKETINGLQQQAQREGRAQPLTTTDLVATQETAHNSHFSIRHERPVEDERWGFSTNPHRPPSKRCYRFSGEHGKYRHQG